MGCGSSQATTTVSPQPAPKLKRIKEEDENALQSITKRSSSSRSSIKESNGHTQRITENGGHGKESSIKQTLKSVSPPSSAIGHVPLSDSPKGSANNSKDSESTSSEEVNENGGTDGPDNTELSPAEGNTGVDTTDATDNVTQSKNSVSSVQENQCIKEEPQKEGSPTSDGDASQGTVTVNEEKATENQSTGVGEKGVLNDRGNEDSPEVDKDTVDETGDVSARDEVGDGVAQIDSTQQNEAQQRVISEVSICGKNEEDPSQDETQGVNGKFANEDKEAAETDLIQQRVASDASLPVEVDNTVATSQTKRSSIASSHHSTLPSDSEVNALIQELDSVLPTPADNTKHSDASEVTKEDPLSPGGEDSSGDNNLGHDSMSAPVGATEATEPSKEDSVLENKESAALLAESTDDFTLKSNSPIFGRICTLSASVLVGSLDNPQGEQNVTLTGSVYRVPRIDGGATAPKPGEKIGIIKGDVTSTPTDDESSVQLATLRGDLLAVSGEAASQGHVATASIDVLSSATGEIIATITADVAPSDDADSPSGVISGEVLGASENGSYDEKIGTLAGKVVALTFDDDTVSLSSADEELLKLRRESCFI